MTEKLQPPIDGSQVPDADAMARDARYREVARVTIVGAILDLAERSRTAMILFLSVGVNAVLPPRHSGQNRSGRP